MNPTAQATVRDWTQTGASELIAHILANHHAFLKSALPRIAALFQRAFDHHKDGKPCDRILFLHGNFTALAAELEAHLRKEELILFPVIEAYERALQAGRPLPRPPFGTVANPIAVMEQEHVDALRTLDLMRENTAGYAPPAHAGELGQTIHASLRELDADVREHIRLENDVLHPKARGLEEAGARSR